MGGFKLLCARNEEGKGKRKGKESGGGGGGGSSSLFTKMNYVMYVYILHTTPNILDLWLPILSITFFYSTTTTNNGHTETGTTHTHTQRECVCVCVCVCCLTGFTLLYCIVL